MKRKKGSYILLISLDKEIKITVGKLGTFSFPSGYYLYIGSALGGLEGRIRRHLRENKKVRWHIDYLLMNSRIIDVWYARAEERLECSWAQDLCTMPTAQALVHGFGSSDCRCPSHLIYFPDKPAFALFQARTAQISGHDVHLARFSMPDAH